MKCTDRKSLPDINKRPYFAQTVIIQFEYEVNHFIIKFIKKKKKLDSLRFKLPVICAMDYVLSLSSFPPNQSHLRVQVWFLPRMECQIDENINGLVPLTTS